MTLCKCHWQIIWADEGAAQLRKDVCRFGRRFIMKLPLTIQGPERRIRSALGFFSVGGSYAALKTSVCTVLAAGALAYHQLVINGHGNADAIGEGLYYYGAADWALACGRWATRYMNSLSGNVIMPGVWILLYMLCVSLTVMLLVKMWDIRGRIAVCLLSAIMAVNPAVIEQSLLQYMFMAWGLSSLLAAVFVYINCRAGSRWLRYTVAPLCMALAFGLYQASLGFVCLCFCMTLILDLLDGRGIRETLLLVVRFAVSSAIGVLVYFAVLRIEFVRFGVDASYRVEQFSISAIFGSLSEAVPDAYSHFIRYFYDAVLNRRLWFALLAVLGALLFAARLIPLLKRRRIAEAVLALLLLCAVPAFANISKIVFPYSTIVPIMEYQNILVVPLLFALVGHTEFKLPQIRQLSRWLAFSLTLILCWTYIVSANATYTSYNLTYEYLHFQTSSILNDIYNMPEYSEDSVIVFAGFPDDSYLRKNIQTYRYSYGMYDNLVFWEEGIGIQGGRRSYLLDYFGIDGGYIYGGQYNDAVHSPEFSQMGVYPAQDSIRQFGDMIIVKLSEDPPIFD